MFRFLKELILDWCLQKTPMSIGDIYAASNSHNVHIDGPDGNLKFIGEGTVDIFVETPNGWSPVKRVLQTVPYDVWELQLEDGKSLKAADEHLVITTNGEKHIKTLSEGDRVLTIDGSSYVTSVSKCDRPAEKMYDLELDDDQHVYYTNGILSHNTTVVAMYILWMTCFQDDKLCVIASKAMNHAVEIVSRIKFAYEELPSWIKPGCRYYSRTSIEFDNGSKIKSEATSEKTGRGGSPSLLFIDEIAFLRKRIQDEMWASIAPSLSTGGKFVLTSTPNGDADLFATIWRGAVAGLNSFVPFKCTWDRHPERDETYYKEMQGKLGPIKTLQELDCQFLSSESLLIDSLKLSYIKESQHVTENMGFKFWKNPNILGGAGKTYLVGVDPATGNGNDYTVIEVLEFPSMVQVAELRMNNVNVPLIYSKIKWLLAFLARSVNGAKSEVVWSFERNGVGEALVAMIQNDDEGDGIYIDNVELYNENDKRLGVYTTGRSKLVSCMQFKNILEKQPAGITINSSILLFELQNFVASGGTYKAKEGATDDAVMAMCVIMKLLNRLSTYDVDAKKIVYESVDPDSDIKQDNGFDEDDAPFVVI